MAKNTTTTTVSKSNTDMFKFDRAFSERITEFMRCKVWGITLRKRWSLEKKQLEAAIDGLRNCEGSIVGDVDADIQAIEAKIAKRQQVITDQLKDEASFSWNDTDNVFYKAYKNAVDWTEVIDGMLDFCVSYGIERNEIGKDIVNDVLATISGGRKASATAIIRSDAKVFTNDKRTKTDVLSLMYGRFAEHCIKAGTIKPADIPEDIREAYAPKKKGNK